MDEVGSLAAEVTAHIDAIVGDTEESMKDMTKEETVEWLLGLCRSLKGVAGCRMMPLELWEVVETEKKLAIIKKESL